MLRSCSCRVHLDAILLSAPSGGSTGGELRAALCSKCKQRSVYSSTVHTFSPHIAFLLTEAPVECETLRSPLCRHRHARTRVQPLVYCDLTVAKTLRRAALIARTRQPFTATATPSCGRWSRPCPWTVVLYDPTWYVAYSFDSQNWPPPTKQWQVRDKTL